jgi:WS/DGAT C-terminal domain
MHEEERLARITAATRPLKESRAEVGTETLVGLGGFFPAAFYRLISAIAGRQRVADLVVSNIPGPQDPMYFAGARLVAYYPVMPLAETMGLSVGVTSLAGRMGFSSPPTGMRCPTCGSCPTALWKHLPGLRRPRAFSIGGRLGCSELARIL